MEPPLTWLYVPGDRPDRFEKALASGADAVIVDLEDAVAPSHKDAARASAAEWLGRPRATGEAPIEVRINGLDTPWAAADLAAAATGAALPRLAGIRLPKAERPEDVARVGDALPPGQGIGVHLLIESARGLEAIADLARAHPAVASLALGEADLRSELGVTDDSGLAWARGRIVVAAAAAGLPPPAMSVYTNVADEAGLAASCRTGRALGFLGRAAIHPRQLPVIEAAFLPDDDEIAAARATLDALAEAAAAGSGTAVLPNGRFVDRAMAQHAERTLALALRARGRVL